MQRPETNPNKIYDLKTPIVPSTLPARERVRYAEFATQVLNGDVLTEDDLPRAEYYGEHNSLYIKTLGGTRCFPAFQFNDGFGRRELTNLIWVSALYLGMGLKRFEWWMSPNQHLEGKTPASLLEKHGDVYEVRQSILDVLSALPLNTR